MYKPDMTQTNEVLSDLGGFVGFPAKFLESHNSFPPTHVNVQEMKKSSATPVDLPKIKKKTINER
jgi:hypothetical protein